MIKYVSIFDEFDDVVEYVDNWLEFVDGEFKKVELA